MELLLPIIGFILLTYGILKYSAWAQTTGDGTTYFDDIADGAKWTAGKTVEASKKLKLGLKAKALKKKLAKDRMNRFYKDAYMANKELKD